MGELLSKPAILEACTPDLSPEERALLLRPAGSPWTESDVPLLDEAAELLGELDAAAGRGPGAAGTGPCPRPGQRQADPGQHGNGRGGRPRHRRGAGGPEPGAGVAADRCRACQHRPHLGLRAHRGGRSAGTVAHAVAAAGAPVPAEVVHDRGRHRPDEFRGRRQLLAQRARPRCSATAGSSRNSPSTTARRPRSRRPPRGWPTRPAWWFRRPRPSGKGAGPRSSTASSKGQIVNKLVEVLPRNWTPSRAACWR